MDALFTLFCRVASLSIWITAFLNHRVVFVSCDAPQSLRFVNILYRHGDRSPIKTFPNDVYQEESWPQGFGQLTTKGMKRCYELGEFLRERYRTFLNDTYISNEIEVLSTDYDRTMQSAAVVLAGLYANVSPDNMFLAGLPWQPVPIHSGIHNGFFIESNKTQSSCTKQSSRSAEMQSAMNEYLWARYPLLLSSLRNESGFEDIAANYGFVADALLCEKSDGRSLPEWAEEALRVYYQEVAPWSFKQGTDTLEKRLRIAGTLFAKILRDMKSAIRDSFPRKVFMYSAHDSTVTQLLVAMDAFNDLTVPFSATVLLELHESSDIQDGHFVRLFYRNDSSHEPFALTIPGCAVDCPFHQFVNLTRHFDVDQAVIDCADDDNGYLFDRLIVVVIVAVTVGTFVLFASLIALSASCRKRRRAWRMNTLNEPTPPPLHYRKFYENADVPEEVPMMTSDFDDSA